METSQKQTKRYVAVGLLLAFAFMASFAAYSFGLSIGYEQGIHDTTEFLECRLTEKHTAIYCMNLIGWETDRTDFE